MVYAKYFSAVRVKLSYLPLRELTLDPSIAGAAYIWVFIVY